MPNPSTEADEFCIKAIKDVVNDTHVHGLLAAGTYVFGHAMTERGAAVALSVTIITASVGTHYALRRRKHRRAKATLPEFHFIISRNF